MSAGRPPTSTVGEPGAHGVVMTGMHGCGVNTPNAAAVAAMTWGFAGLRHSPNGAMLAPGAESVIVAAGIPDAVTRLVGGTVSGDGVAPNEHLTVAPFTAMGPGMTREFTPVRAPSALVNQGLPDRATHGSGYLTSCG